MLKLENVSKSLNGFRLDNISLELPDGYIMGLIGENGAGKTTLIHILSGLYSKDGGSMWLDGMKYGDREDGAAGQAEAVESARVSGKEKEAGDARTAEETVKQKLGVVIHGDIFDGQGTLKRNAGRYGRFYRNYDEEALQSYMEEFRLDGRRRYCRLSKGEKLKFAFAFALSHKPKLLLLDEPTANFDKEFRQAFWDILRQYTADGEHSVILSTHMTSDIDRTADYLLYLKGGRQVLYGDIESVRGAYRMVSGEGYKIKLLKDRVIHMEAGEFGARALVSNVGSNAGKPFDPALRTWEPSIEELMYHMHKEVTGEVK